MSEMSNSDSLPDVLPGFAEGKPREQKCKKRTKDVLPEVTEVLAYLNAKIGTHYSVSPDLSARIRAGASVAQAEQIIDKKVAEWQGTEMARYLRPSTLFCAKHFDEYLNQPVTVPVGSRHVNASWPASAYGHGEDLDPAIKALDDMEGDDL